MCDTRPETTDAQADRAMNYMAVSTAAPAPKIKAEIKRTVVASVVIEMPLEDARNLHNQACAGMTAWNAQHPSQSHNRAVLARLVDALTIAGVQLNPPNGAGCAGTATEARKTC